MDSIRRHPAILIAPLVAAAVIVLLIGIRSSGASYPWLQGVTFTIALALLAVAFVDMLVRDIRRTHLHTIGLRISILGIMVLEAVLLFASIYLVIADQPGEMTGLKTPLDAAYFTMTTLMTIGFGDISAEGQIARGVVLTQMIFTVLLLSASVRLFSSLVRSVAREAGSHDGPDGRRF